MMFARAAGMAVGGSGVSPAVLDALLAMLNAGVHPVVPRCGSIGVADLRAAVALALAAAWAKARPSIAGDDPAGRRSAGTRAGLAPVVLGPRTASR